MKDRKINIFAYTALVFVALMSLGAYKSFFHDDLVVGTMAIGKSSVADSKSILELHSTSKGFLPPRMTTTQRDNISSPPAGLVIFNTTANKLNQYNGAAWTDVGSGAGGINYIPGGDAESGTTGSSTYADAAGTSPVDGTGGSPNVTWTTSASNPLRDANSFLFTKDAANRQGEGVSFAFTVDAADKTKVLQGSFDYAVSSGTFADDDVTVWIYDVTNAALIQPAPYKLKNHTLAAERFNFEFQATGSTSYRLIIHVSTSSAEAYTLKFDNFNVGPHAKLYGSPITDSKTATPIWTNLGFTPSTNVIEYWRVGGRMCAKGLVAYSSGSGSGSTLSLALPDGLSIDTAKLGTTDSTQVLEGTWRWYDDSGSSTVLDDNFGPVVYGTTTTVRFGIPNDSNVFFSSVMSTSDRFSFHFCAPILGWGSQVIMSSDADTRVVAARMYRGSNQTGVNPNNTYVKINIDTTSFDTHAAFSVANNRYVAQVPGIYRVSGSIYLVGTNVLNNLYQGNIYKNGSLYAAGVGHYPAATGPHSLIVSDLVQLNAGDYVELYLYGAGNNSSSTLTVSGVSSNTYLSVEKISGPSQVAASESVLASIGGNPASANSGDPIIFPTVSFDSHGSYNATTGLYTCPSPGTYRMSGTISSAVAGAGINAYRGGSSIIPICFTDSNGECTMSGILKCLAGETLSVRPSATVDADASSVLHIERVGNY